MHMGARTGRQRAGTDVMLGRISVCVGGGGGCVGCYSPDAGSMTNSFGGRWGMGMGGCLLGTVWVSKAQGATSGLGGSSL